MNQIWTEYKSYDSSFCLLANAHDQMMTRLISAFIRFVPLITQFPLFHHLSTVLHSLDLSYLRSRDSSPVMSLCSKFGVTGVIIAHSAHCFTMWHKIAHRNWPVMIGGPTIGNTTTQWEIRIVSEAIVNTGGYTVECKVENRIFSQCIC